MPIRIHIGKQWIRVQIWIQIKARNILITYLFQKFRFGLWKQQFSFAVYGWYFAPWIWSVDLHIFADPGSQKLDDPMDLDLDPNFKHWISWSHQINAYQSIIFGLIETMQNNPISLFLSNRWIFPGSIWTDTELLWVFFLVLH